MEEGAEGGEAGQAGPPDALVTAGPVTPDTAPDHETESTAMSEIPESGDLAHRKVARPRRT